MLQEVSIAKGVSWEKMLSCSRFWAEERQRGRRRKCQFRCGFGTFSPPLPTCR